MGIFDRMGKVIQSNLNSLLDKAEDDKKLIELNLDEMDEQIKAGHQEVVQAVAAGETAPQESGATRQADVARWEKRAELALKSSDEALAREALKQKKRVTSELENVDKARSDQREAALRMKDELERMKEKLAQLKMRKGTMVARAAQSRGGSGAEQLGSKGGSSAFDNFRRMEEKIEGREAEGAAMAEVEEALGTGEKRDDIEAKFRARAASWQRWRECRRERHRGRAGGLEKTHPHLAGLENVFSLRFKPSSFDSLLVGRGSKLRRRLSNVRGGPEARSGGHLFVACALAVLTRRGIGRAPGRMECVALCLGVGARLHRGSRALRGEHSRRGPVVRARVGRWHGRRRAGGIGRRRRSYAARVG